MEREELFEALLFLGESGVVTRICPMVPRFSPVCFALMIKMERKDISLCLTADIEVKAWKAAAPKGPYKTLLFSRCVLKNIPSAPESGSEVRRDL